MLLRATIAAVALLVSSNAVAVLFAELSLEQKVAQSELVVIVRVVSAKSVKANDVYEVTTVRVESVLKGAPKETLQVITQGGFPESDPSCCESGSAYLMFLKPAKNGWYVSVNGPHGIYLIRDKSLRK